MNECPPRINPALGLIGLTVSVILWTTLFHFVPSIPPLLTGILGMIGGFAVNAGIYFYVRRRMRRAVLQLIATEDVRSVGCLAEALWFQDEAVVSPAITKALIRLLPQVGTVGYDVLNPYQKQCLCNVLKQSLRNSIQRITRPDCYDPELNIAILYAFEWVGDQDCLPIIQQVAAQGEDERVRHAAQHCLYVLRPPWREGQETLLRASQVPPALPAELLRPAESSVVDPPSELLRPVDLYDLESRE